jgi:hypothetical protein
MGAKKNIIMIMAVFFLISACQQGIQLAPVASDQALSAATNNEAKGEYYAAFTSVDPIPLSRVDIGKKIAYINNASTTLKHFYTVACDINKRGDAANRKLLGLESSKYILQYVKPILNDPGAINDIHTKAKVANLHLECAYLFYAVEGYNQARYHLRRLVEGFESSFIMSIPADKIYSDINTVAEGIAYIDRMITMKQGA